MILRTTELWLSMPGEDLIITFTMKMQIMVDF